MSILSVSLPDEIKAFVEQRVAEDGHASAVDYVCSLIQEDRKRRAKRTLESQLLEGLQSPAVEMTEAHWAGLRERILDRNPELSA